LNSKLILGTVQFGMDYGINNKKGKPSFSKVKDILDFASLKGINLLDTAEAYGNSQSVIGKYHKGCSEKFNIITKFSDKRIDLPKNIIKRVNDNITTLNVDFLYSYMFHSFDDYKKYFSLFKNDLISLKKINKIKKIGVSLHSNDEIVQVLKNDQIHLIQLPFNLLDNSNQREEILLKAKSKNIEIHTRSVFLQGLFFKDFNKVSGSLLDFRQDLNKLNNLVSKDRMNDLALNYVCSKDYIDGVLLGVDSVDQLKSNIYCIESNTTKDIICEVDKIDIINKKMLNPANWTK
jgi:uncharacterized protein